MLIKEEKLRWHLATHERMKNAREWLDVAEEIQIQIVNEYGYVGKVNESYAAHLLRTAHVKYPDLKSISVYARENIARDGELKEGQTAPDVPLLDPAGAPCRLSELIKATQQREGGGGPLPFTLIVAGSHT
mmetsp:Transcript_27832/g.80120  ORF Transcript_27832/g.80120 Transcript_27832/m.80120 type:complete len:131 (-) Transcript_27832:1395-1787(-)